jgi:hypothetical protein
MKLIIDIPDEYYKSIKNTAVFISGQRSGKSFINHLCNAVANGIPQETVTEFADRCKECGKMRTGHCKECKYFRKLPYHADTLGKCVHHTGFCPKGDWYCADFDPQESEDDAK